MIYSERYVNFNPFTGKLYLLIVLKELRKCHWINVAFYLRFIRTKLYVRFNGNSEKVYIYIYIYRSI